jgi:hypothetical protein
LFLCIALFITSCQKESLQSISQSPDLLSSSQKQKLQKKAVPFKAYFVTTDVATTFVGNIQYDHIIGTGNGTHIGKATIDIYAEGDITLPFPALVTGKATITAANGDQIFLTAIGYVDEPGANGDLHLTGDVTITGGTGRFEGATGHLVSVVTGSIFNPEGTLSYEGTISY